MPREDWLRVSKADPCTICNKPDNCCISRDGSAALCGRVSDGSVGQNAGGQYLHILNRGQQRHRSRPVRQEKQSRAESAKHTNGRCKWEAWANAYAQTGQDKLGELADALGVSEESLQALLVGYASAGYWTFPERNDSGRVVGIMRRFENGDKIFLRGGNRGLYFADDFSAPPGPIYVVEGGSCTAAGLTMGLAVVGRPSNVGGVKFLTKLLSSISKDREIIVMGERDEKPDGKWSGRDGAITTAKKIANGLNRPVSWSLPPEGAKDLREWLQLKRK